MSIIDTLLGGGAGGIGQMFKDIVGMFKLSPETQAELTKQLEDHKFELAKMDAELEEKLQATAASNIQSEEKSGDKFTSRARPTFMYIMEAILLWNYAVVPLFKQAPVDLPEPLFWLFGSCMLGYTGARTWEKISTLKSQS
jgi:hypothetical protein